MWCQNSGLIFSLIRLLAYFHLQFYLAIIFMHIYTFIILFGSFCIAQSQLFTIAFSFVDRVPILTCRPLSRYI